MGMSIDTSGARRILERAKRQVAKAADETEQEAAQQLADDLERGVRRDTGYMARSIEVQFTGGRFWVVVPMFAYGRYYYPAKYRNEFKLLAVRARPRIEQIMRVQFSNRLPDQIGKLR